MRLSNRLWNAIAHRFRDHEDDYHEEMVWAKIVAPHPEKRKRHFLREIDLSFYERVAVADLIAQPRDDYLRFCIEHERKTNPEFERIFSNARV